MKKIYYHRILVFVVISIFVILGCGCVKEEQSVLVVLSSKLDMSYSDLEAVAKRWADEKDIYLQVVASELSTVSGQQAILEKSIKEKEWDLIVVDPLGSSELSPLLDYAKERGSTIVAMQGTGKLTTDYILQPCDYEELGSAMMDSLAEKMNKSGSYVTIVPSKESDVILQEELACVDRQKRQYQQMLATSRLQESGDLQKAYDITDALYHAYEMKGVLFFSYIDGLGISQWKQNTGNDVTTVGIGLPENMKEAVDNGSVDVLFYWNRENLLEASLEVGYKSITGSVQNDSDIITTGVDGYRTLRTSGGGVYVGSDITSISK